MLHIKYLVQYLTQCIQIIIFFISLLHEYKLVEVFPSPLPQSPGNPVQVHEGFLESKVQYLTHTKYSENTCCYYCKFWFLIYISRDVIMSLCSKEGTVFGANRFSRYFYFSMICLFCEFLRLFVKSSIISFLFL